MTTWWGKNIDDWGTYIRSYGEGVGFPSRKWLAGHLLPGASLLDVGCGGAIELESLIHEGRKDVTYTGCDYTEEAIAKCKELYPDHDFFVDDARHLGTVADSRYDIVLLRHTLDHIDDWEATLREAWRVAKKEVIVILWASVFENDREPSYQAHDDDGHFRMYSPQHMMRWAVENLQPVSYGTESISAKEVKGREHRTDTVIIFRK